MATPATAPITPDVQKALYDEADARFWAQTGYRPGQKLDPKSASDKHMIPAWIDAYQKVLAQYKNGTIQWTKDDPIVKTGIANAAAHSEAAATSLHAAATTTEPANVKSNLDAARAAKAEAARHAREAASVQPATVSPALVAEGGRRILDFHMDGGGRSEYTGEHRGYVRDRLSPEEALAIMQAADAGAAANANAQTAPPSQTAPVVAPPESPSVAEDRHKKIGALMPVAVGVAIAAGVYGIAYVAQHAGSRLRRRSRRSGHRAHA